MDMSQLVTRDSMLRMNDTLDIRVLNIRNTACQK